MTDNRRQTKPIALPLGHAYGVMILCMHYEHMDNVSLRTYVDMYIHTYIYIHMNCPVYSCLTIEPAIYGIVGNFQGVQFSWISDLYHFNFCRRTHSCPSCTAQSELFCRFNFSWLVNYWWKHENWTPQNFTLYTVSVDKINPTSKAYLMSKSTMKSSNYVRSYSNCSSSSTSMPQYVAVTPPFKHTQSKSPNW